MPATFTRTPTETERKDPGFGGKPPVDRRPTGGNGDGENWENRRPGRRGPREILSRYRMALFSILAADLMLFIALAVTFFARQQGGHFDASNAWVFDWHPLAIPPVLWINTAVLLLSSLTMEVARRHFFRETDVMEEWLGLGRPTVRRAAPWLAATGVLGGLFLAGQWIAWKQLVAEGVFSGSNPSSYFFYLITGTHAMHLLLGVLALSACMISLMLLRRVELRQVAVDCTAWYWHAMGVFWFFLFGLLVLGQ
jgi:cytochrome c oxidase subunit III